MNTTLLLPKRAHSLTIERLYKRAHDLHTGDWMKVWFARLHMTRWATHSLYGNTRMRLHVLGEILDAVREEVKDD